MLLVTCEGAAGSALAMAGANFERANAQGVNMMNTNLTHWKVPQRPPTDTGTPHLHWHVALNSGQTLMH